MSKHLSILSTQELEDSLAETSWKTDEGKLFQVYTFPSYAKAADFVQALAATAEELNHHPDILFTWKKVSVWLFTHDVNGLTKLDTQFATLANEHFSSFSHEN